MNINRSNLDVVTSARLGFEKKSKANRLVLGALFACMAAILQATGGIFPGVGFFISPLATAPILVCSMLSLPFGVMSYLLTNGLLLVLQPSELFIFPFTTGLLGLGIGAAFYFFEKRWIIIVTGASLLTIGICSLLYVFRFPALGPIGTDSLSLSAVSAIFFCAILYSWVWVYLGLLFIKRLKNIFSS